MERVGAEGVPGGGGGWGGGGALLDGGEKLSDFHRRLLLDVLEVGELPLKIFNLFLLFFFLFAGSYTGTW